MATALALSPVEGGQPSPSETAVLLDKEPASEKEEPQQGPRNVLPIPASLWKSREAAINKFLEEELNLCEGERYGMMLRMARWKEGYLAPAAEGAKNFPFHNASNLVIPIIKEHAHTLIGQLVQSTVANRPHFILKDLAPEWEPLVDNIERFMDIAGERDLNLEEVYTELIIECAILGTAIAEVPYEVDERRVYRYSADGKSTYPQSVIFHDGPILKHVPIASFWIRNHERDPQKARWVAKRMLLSEMELREKEAQGKFYGINALLKHYDDKAKELLGNSPSPYAGAREDSVREREDQILAQTSLRPDRFEIFEICLSYDIDGDGRFEELRVYYHREARLFIGRQFLPYWSGLRGFVKMGYFPRVDRFYDEGIAEMLEQIQIAVSAIANRRADNATLANLKMIIKRKIMKNLQPGDPLYPGKQIEVNDIWNDIREFSMSDVYPSTVNEENILRQVADNLSGLSEAARGSAMPVTRTTAAAQLALLQEQRNRLGMTITNIRRAQRKIGQHAFWHYSQFGTGAKGLLWMGEQGRIVDQIFRMPRRVKELIQAIEVSTPTSMQNRQVKRENAIGMFNLLVQLYERLLPIAQQMAPEALQEVVRGMVSSARSFMEDVLETFDSSDPEAVLEGIAVLERLLRAPEDLGGMAAFNQRAEGSAQLDQLSRVENLLREVEAVRASESRSASGDTRGRRNAPPEGATRGDIPGVLFGGDSLFRSR